MAEKSKAARPGGRTLDTANKVAAAVLQLLEDGGHAAVTYQAVTETSGVGRATLYRRWPTRSHLISFASLTVLSLRIEIPDKGSLHADLTTLLVSINQFTGSKLGRALMLAALEMGSQKNAGTTPWPARWQQVEVIFQRAFKRKEISAEADVEAAFSMASGSIYFARILRSRALTKKEIQSIVGLCVTSIQSGVVR